MKHVCQPFGLSLKVFDTEVDGVRRQFLCASFYMNPTTGEGLAFLLSDDMTFQHPMHVEQWNALPFVRFITDGVEAVRPPKTWIGEPPSWRRPS